MHSRRPSHPPTMTREQLLLIPRLVSIELQLYFLQSDTVNHCNCRFPICMNCMRLDLIMASLVYHTFRIMVLFVLAYCCLRPQRIISNILNKFGMTAVLFSTDDLGHSSHSSNFLIRVTTGAISYFAIMLLSS